MWWYRLLVIRRVVLATPGTEWPISLLTEGFFEKMYCPFCNHSESKVIDSRDSGDGIRRRRECIMCSLRFTTYELIQSRALLVIKVDERREEFQREKLWASLLKACAKRPLPVGMVEKVMQEIESELADSGKPEIASKVIGEMVISKLKDVDRVAYIRFASVYRDFRDIETFKEEIDALLEPVEPIGVPSNQLSFLEDREILPPPRRRRRRPPKTS